jgi:hypothetical protein
VVNYAKNLIKFLGPLRVQRSKALQITFDQLRARGGWTYAKSSGLGSWEYRRPGIEKLMPHERVLGVHVFEDEEKTIEWALKHKIDFNTRFGHIDEEDATSTSSLNGGGGGGNVEGDNSEHWWRDPLDDVFGESEGGNVNHQRGYGASGGYEVIVIIIHSLDGNPSLRSPSNQLALSLLANSPRIRLVASVDHINAPLMWDVKISENYGWLWQEASTCFSYDLEGQSLLESVVSSHYKTKKVQIQAEVDEGVRDTSTIVGILSNITDKHKKTLIHIALTGATGINFSTLFSECVKKLLYLNHDEKALRKCLQELKDQRLITGTNKFKVDEATLLVLKAQQPDLFNASRTK